MLAKEASEQSPCCSRKCVHKLYTQCGEALVDAVLDRALTVYSGNQNRSFDRLAQVLRGGYESASDKFDYMFDHGGYLRSFDHRGPIYTCGRAWEVLHQVSKHIRLVIQRSVVDNEPTYIRQRKQYESRQTGPREHVRMFLEHFFSDDLGHVEIMPFHDGNSETFKKHLPPWMTKICVYYYYKSWAEDDNAILRDLATESEVKLASFDTFRRTWKEDFPDVTTPKVKRFSHCPICAAGKALRDQAREICTKDMTPEERQVHRQHQQLVRRQVRAEQKVHLERVRQERRDLNNAVFQSRLGHGNFFFFEIDSMDSAKTLLPHWVRIPKTVKPDMLLKYHLTCVKYDGYRPDDIYYYTNTIPHDSSTTCTLIWITIMKEIQHRGRKIPYIRIQMDNTVRENKNRNVAALCNWLVSIGICDVIHLVFLPVGHTHERVDQIFSRISLALSRSSAYTIEAFLDLVAKAFSPTPEIAELSISLDFSEWLRPHFQDHILDISKPHKFEFTRDDAAASGGSLRTALWSNTPLSEPVQILKSAPTGTPEIRAGRPLLYALCDKKKPDAVKVQRYLDDFKKVRSYITDLAVQWHFSPVERESWKNLLDDLDEMQTAPSAAFSGFWPQRKEEVDDFLREHGQTAPAEARHTMATNADLNNAEAARVEAEVRAQVLQDDSAFRGVHAGAKERLHDNTSPSDAKGSNLVVIDVSDTKGGKKPVDTSWEKCLTLPWKLVEAVPLSYAKAIHDASGSREVFNEDGTMVRKKCHHRSEACRLSDTCRQSSEEPHTVSTMVYTKSDGAPSAAGVAAMAAGTICVAKMAFDGLKGLIQNRKPVTLENYQPKKFCGKPRILGVVPARYGSTRFPGKPLALIGDKPMIWHTYTNSLKCNKLDKLVVATDDQRIFDAVIAFGGNVVMTDPKCNNGTERCLEVLQAMQAQGEKYDIVVNIQGDEPFIEEIHISTVIETVTSGDAVMGTLARPANENDEADVTGVNNVKTVLDVHGNALYFSRAMIPHNKKAKYDPNTHYWRKLGIYVYRADFLPLFVIMPESLLQKSEDLEQNKVIEAGFKIRVGIVEEAVHGVDTPEQLEDLNKQLKEGKITL
eukprot:jgi/Tetstr1/456710/TSEL_043410.t1